MKKHRDEEWLDAGWNAALEKLTDTILGAPDTEFDKLTTGVNKRNMLFTIQILLDRTPFQRFGSRDQEYLAIVDAMLSKTDPS
jgi:hypothetical protein